jgi:hypothetical protein
VKAPVCVVTAALASTAALGFCANSVFGLPTHSDPPVLVPWSRVGDISLGEPFARVAAEYGGAGHGFQVVSRNGDTVQGSYTLHHGRVILSLIAGRVFIIDFATPYYRTASGFGIGSQIPLNQREWHGFLFHKTFPGDPSRTCGCWMKVGNGATSLPATGANVSTQPVYTILTTGGRVTEIMLQAAY